MAGADSVMVLKRGGLLGRYKRRAAHASDRGGGWRPCVRVARGGSVLCRGAWRCWCAGVGGWAPRQRPPVLLAARDQPAARSTLVYWASSPCASWGPWRRGHVGGVLVSWHGHVVDAQRGQPWPTVGAEEGDLRHVTDYDRTSTWTLTRTAPPQPPHLHGGMTRATVSHSNMGSRSSSMIAT